MISSRAAILRRWVVIPFLLLACEAHSTRAGLRIVLPSAVQELDPRFASDTYGVKLSRLLFSSLWTIDARTLDLTPDLADSFEWVDDRTVHILLRQGVTFSDGSILDASDVVATLRGIKNSNLRSPYNRTFERLLQVDRLDARTVRLVFDGHLATWQSDLEVPIVREEDSSRRLDWRRGIVGSGPYLFAGCDGAQDGSCERLDFSRNTSWHRGRARYAPLSFDVVRDENTRVMRLLTGKADIALNAISAELLPVLRDEPGLSVRTAPGVSTTYLGFQTDRLPHSVRHAIASLIDRHLLAEAKTRGHGKVADTWIPDRHWARCSDQVDGQRFSFVPMPERDARRLARSFSRPLLMRTSHDRGRVSLARAIAGMLRDAGFRVELRTQENASTIAELNLGNFDLTVMQIPEVFDPHTLSWFFTEARIPNHGAPGANRWRYRSPATDAAFEEGRTASTRDARVAAYCQIQSQLIADLPVLPLWQDDAVLVARRDLDVIVPRSGRFDFLAAP